VLRTYAAPPESRRNDQAGSTLRQCPAGEDIQTKRRTGISPQLPRQSEFARRQEAESVQCMLPRSPAPVPN
jgi:hypothetical protein